MVENSRVGWEPKSPLFRSLRHRNFRLFLGGQMISLIGTWMQSVAQSWLVYRLTGSPVLLGAVGFANQIPVFMLSVFGGTVADRFNRRYVVIATQVSSMILALTLATLTFTGIVQVWHILTLATLLGMVNAFDIPARQSFLLEMVTRDDLPNAIALNSSMFNGARIVGPAIAGVLVGVIGEAWCFLGNGLSYIAVLAGLLMMRIERDVSSRRTQSTFESIVEGFRFVSHTRPIWTILALLGVVSLVGTPYTVLMPVFAETILHGGPSALGVLMSATGLGALTGALFLARRSGFRGLGRMIAASAVAFGITLILFSLSKTLWLSVVLLFPVGFSMMTQTASSNTLIQAMVPDELRGRVMAVYTMVFMGMAPFGALFAGTVADLLGAPGVVALGGCWSIIAGIWFSRVLPQIRGHVRQLIVARQAGAGDPPEETTLGFSLAQGRTPVEEAVSKQDATG
jgi:MFS family permease